MIYGHALYRIILYNVYKKVFNQSWFGNPACPRTLKRERASYARTVYGIRRVLNHIIELHGFT